MGDHNGNGFSPLTGNEGGTTLSNGDGYGGPQAPLGDHGFGDGDTGDPWTGSGVGYGQPLWGNNDG